MTEELSESPPARANTRRDANNKSWFGRKRVDQTIHPLPAELVDAALTDEREVLMMVDGAHRAHRSHEPESGRQVTHPPEYLTRLSNQLAQLDSQREQIQRLLAEADQEAGQR